MTEIKLTTAVKEIESATSPLANLVNILDITPPGAAAIIIVPKASSGGSEIIWIKIKAMIGNKITWPKKPTIKSRGILSSLVKSATVRQDLNRTLLWPDTLGLLFLLFP